MVRAHKGHIRRTRLGTVEREVLEELSAGDLFIGFLCSARSTRRMYKIAHERAKHRYHTRLAIERLAREGHIRRNGELLSINTSGRRLLDQTVENVRATLRKKKWDGKWRIVTFDIPEQLRESRNAVRAILKRAGFVKLQHSVWIFPHECEELARLIKEDARLSHHVLYGVLEKIEDDARLRRAFL